MTDNEVVSDRGIRVALGAGLLTPLGWLGLVPLGTGVLGTCPIYRLLGVSTRRLTQQAGR